MITVRCTYGNDDTTVTQINLTPDEARSYFLGRWFNVGSGPDDNMQQCVAIEVLDTGEAPRADVSCRYCGERFNPGGKVDMCSEAPASVLYHAERK